MAPSPERYVVDGPVPSGAPASVVLGFLESMALGQLDTTLALIADDLVYENVSLPTITGRDRFAVGARRFFGAGLGFEVAVHRVTVAGDTVQTERTDAITWGPFRTQFWVCGVFEVHDGAVTLWRDYFDWWNITLASLRGLLGIVVPGVRAKLR